MKIPPLGTYGLLEKNLAPREKRSYLGCSIIGGPCDRRLYFEYYDIPEEFSRRTLRIFALGSAVEGLVVDELKKSGIIVYDTDSQGKQWECNFDDPRIKGHADGVVMNLPESSKPHLLEVKSANDNSFKKFQKEGIEAASNQYYVQANLYMMALGLEKCLFVVYNKDNSEFYIERIKFNKLAAEMAYQKAITILDGTCAPERPFSTQSHYICKMCNWRNKCWSGK